MSSLKHFIFICHLVTIAEISLANCDDLKIDGFDRDSKKQNVQIYVNQKNQATIAVQCQPLTVSKQEAVNEFSKAGKIQKHSDNLFYFQTEVSGVFSRTYLEIGKQTRTLSLITKAPQDLSKMDKDIQETLKRSPIEKD